jgi:hypothetical protein
MKLVDPACFNAWVALFRQILEIPLDPALESLTDEHAERQKRKKSKPIQMKKFATHIIYRIFQK